MLLACSVIIPVQLLSFHDYYHILLSSVFEQKHDDHDNDKILNF